MTEKIRVLLRLFCERSVVNAAIRKLLKEDIITVDLKEYSIPDKFLWLWVNRQYNNA